MLLKHRCMKTRETGEGDPSLRIERQRSLIRNKKEVRPASRRSGEPGDDPAGTISATRRSFMDGMLALGRKEVSNSDLLVQRIVTDENAGKVGKARNCSKDATLI